MRLALTGPRGIKRSSRCSQNSAEAGTAASDVARGRREEVVALVVDHDEGGEVQDLDPKDRLHAELGVGQDLDLGDVVPAHPRALAPDRAQIEAAVLLAGLRDRARA